MAAPAEERSGRECDCKVGRVLERWDRIELGDQLATEWAEGEASLRELARTLNIAVLRSATSGSDVARLEGETENLYRLLTDDDVTSGTRMQARNRLERSGVDVSAVEADFVSHQTIHTHFRDCLNVDRVDDRESPKATARQRVRSLQSRMEAVTKDALSHFDGDHEVFVDVTVRCQSCGSRYEFGQFVDQSGCNCGTE